MEPETDLAMDAIEPPEPAPVPEPEPRKIPFWDYKDLLIFLLMAFPCFVLGALFVQLIAGVVPGFPPGKAPRALLGQFTAYGLWFGSLYLILKTKYDEPFWKSMGCGFPWPNVLRTLFWGPMLAFAVAGLGMAMRTPDIEMPFKEYLSDPLSIALVGIFAATLGPLCEELAFRGFLLPLLRRSFGPVPAIIGAALPFALLHGPQYAWSWRHILLVALAGIAFGWVRHRTGSTAAATIMHGTYNLTFFSAYLLQGRSL